MQVLGGAPLWMGLTWSAESDCGATCSPAFLCVSVIQPNIIPILVEAQRFKYVVQKRWDNYTSFFFNKKYRKCFGQRGTKCYYSETCIGQKIFDTLSKIGTAKQPG